MFETRELNIDNIETRVIASVQTDPGCVRLSNEDSGRYFSPNDAEIRAQKGTLTIVADGMGGHASGEVASKMAVEVIHELYYNDDNPSRPEALRSAIEAANTRIFDASASDEELAGMGTTVIALVLLGETAFSAHVGDSRLYRLRSRRLEMLTLDHSEVMEMVKNGQLTMEQARNHEDKNVILRAVGTQPTVEVEVSEPFAVNYGDIFLLCSDGLSDMLEDTEIEEILDSEPDPYAACERLIAEARHYGGHDNITAGIVRVYAQEIRDVIQDVRITREVEAFG